MKKPIIAAPLAPYIGGKRILSKRITPLIDSTPHTMYCEGFVGMGGIFLRRSKLPKSEVINDFNREIANFFRILQRHYVAFLDMLKFQVTTRSEFERLCRVDASTLTDLECAARFLYLQRTAFGGKVTGRSFGVTPDRPARFNITTLAPMLEEVHERLSGVVIECLNYADFISRYDRATTLFYFDPPYYGTEKEYGKELFSREEFPKMAAILGRLKGKFILSINDVPAIRKAFAGFKMESVDCTYSVAKSTSKAVKELIITNF